MEVRGERGEGLLRLNGNLFFFDELFDLRGNYIFDEFFILSINLDMIGIFKLTRFTDLNNVESVAVL